MEANLIKEQQQQQQQQLNPAAGRNNNELRVSRIERYAERRDGLSFNFKIAKEGGDGGNQETGGEHNNDNGSQQQQNQGENQPENDGYNQPDVQLAAIVSENPQQMQTTLAEGQYSSSSSSSLPSSPSPQTTLNSISSYSVGGAQLNNHHHQRHRQPTTSFYEPQQSTQQPQQQQPTYNYVKLDHERQSNHLAQHQAEHQARLAELNQMQEQTTTPMTLTTLTLVEEQQQQGQNTNEQQQTSTAENDANSNGNNGYVVEQIHSSSPSSQPIEQQRQQQADANLMQSHQSPQSSGNSLIMNESPMQVPILDQQSLLPDSQNLNQQGDQHQQQQQQQLNVNNNEEDTQRQAPQQSPGVYQVYQAYYAPKDHKPLPGYVRLSLEEFNELFRDAEIQYVDRNLNNLNVLGQTVDSPTSRDDGAEQPLNNNNNNDNRNNNNNNNNNNNLINDQTNAQAEQQYDPNANQHHQQASYPMTGENMKASASEIQSILVDGRSIPHPAERRSSLSSLTNSTTLSNDSDENNINNSLGPKTKLKRAVKKIITIRNSRHLAKPTGSSSKLVMKRIRQQQIQSGTQIVSAKQTAAPQSTTTVSGKHQIQVSSKESGKSNASTKKPLKDFKENSQN